MNLELDGLTKRFGDLTVLDRVSLILKEIHSLVLIGPSGGGKTTLLRILAGLEQPEEGRVIINGSVIDYREEALREHRKRIGMVFQSYNLFPHLTALQNITLPLVKVHHLTPDQAVDEAMTLLSRFHLDDHAHKKPAALSGGQKQAG